MFEKYRTRSEREAKRAEAQKKAAQVDDLQRTHKSQTKGLQGQIDTLQTKIQSLEQRNSALANSDNPMKAELKKFEQKFWF